LLHESLVKEGAAREPPQAGGGGSNAIGATASARLDQKSACRGFEACALMSLRRRLSRGSARVDHSIALGHPKGLLLRASAISTCRA